VRLFADRAKAAVPDFEIDERNGPALMRLCHHLDGNPLAIELAAVRLRALTPQQLEERLGERYELLTEGRRTAPARQQTLRALIDWSYELLSEPERELLQRLSVFSGGWTLAAAETVCASTPHPPSPSPRTFGRGEGELVPWLLPLLLGQRGFEAEHKRAVVFPLSRREADSLGEGARG
jgi:predicted ATPase